MSSSVRRESDIKKNFIKLVDTRIGQLQSVSQGNTVPLIKCTQEEYDIWNNNGLINEDFLYGVIIEK